MKKVFITGVSRGIGKATALKYLQEGYEVIGTSTSGNSDIEDKKFECMALDLSDRKSIDSLISNLKSKNIQFDIIINNAAILIEEWGKPDSSIDVDSLRKTFDVNFFGIVQITESLMQILNMDAMIINISSNWGSFSDPAFDPYHPLYKMSKAALNMYTKLLGCRLMDERIKVAAFDPGWVKTDMGTDNAFTSPEETAQQIFDLSQSDIPTEQFWRNGKVRDW